MHSTGVWLPEKNKEIKMNIVERDEKGVTVYVLEGRIDSQGSVSMDQALQSAMILC